MKTKLIATKVVVRCSNSRLLLDGGAKFWLTYMGFLF